MGQAFSASGGPKGASAISPSVLGAQLAAVFDGYLAESTVEVFAERGRRRTKIRDREQWIKWQKEKQPQSRWLKSEMKRRSGRTRPFSEAQLKTRCLTGYTTWYNAGEYAKGFDDPDVEAFMFSAIRDGHECKVCRALDGRIRPKTDDEFWVKYTPAIHHGCRCRIVALLRGEGWKATPKAYFTGLNPQIGFGGTAKKMDVPAGFKTRAEKITPVSPGI